MKLLSRQDYHPMVKDTKMLAHYILADINKHLKTQIFDSLDSINHHIYDMMYDNLFDEDYDSLMGPNRRHRKKPLLS